MGRVFAARNVRVGAAWTVRGAGSTTYSDLDERAAELGAKVDAGDWSELGFGSS